MNGLMETVNTWTAVVTPFLEDLSVDFSVLETLLKRQEEAGCGVVLVGSTGEGLALNDKEKLDIIDCAASLSLKVPLVVGVAGFNLDQCLQFVRESAKRSVDGFLLVTPIYARPGILGQTQWFKTLLDAATKPCLLYNIPKRAGCDLELEVVKALAEHHNFWGIKEASGKPENVEMYREEAPNARIFCGSDDQMRAYARSGACGLISVIGNLWPELTRKWVDVCLRSPEENDSDRLLETVRRAGFNNPVGAKAYLYAKKIIATPYLRPPLSHLDMDKAALHELLKFEPKRCAAPAPH